MERNPQVGDATVQLLDHVPGVTLCVHGDRHLYQALSELLRPARGSVPQRQRRTAIRLFVAAIAVVGLGIGLLTSIGTSSNGGPPHAGGKAPTFSLPGVNVANTVGTPESGGGDGRPMVVLFMGDWCTICHSELPPLAAKIRSLQEGHGGLSQLVVI